MTVDTKPNDLLLLAGKVIAVFMQIAMAVGGAALLVALPAILIFRDDVSEAFGSEADYLASPLLYLAGVMLIGLAIVAMLFVFFGTLRRIIATVGEGDPFAPANANRLSLMGWLMLGVQLSLIPATALGIQLARYADETEDMNLTVDGGGMDLTGILLVIILFILARVFRHGAAMREDLEGTV
ncbi:DUF2975 domain-containing protein [Aurantiacibacter poecillastricola]|uniref:DUF2975 domain-containing protein n=1 Tax=Aurantiacibacter poecillastricola TaxID=3064385 RepID=UPI00273D4768|nr:DUF2975 domain-containing protein [Aurantiacibacter sp. 219JJ12-13]MDP5260191.1 DUF2975 domain-containing protein [Aurantiacibacter sp. 219JJ12-13]